VLAASTKTPFWGKGTEGGLMEFFLIVPFLSLARGMGAGIGRDEVGSSNGGGPRAGAIKIA